MRKAFPGTLSDNVLTVAQVADYLQLNKLTIYKYVRDGKIPAVKIGRVIRLRAEDVARFLEAQRVTPTERRPARAAGAQAAPAARAPNPALPAARAGEEIYIGPQRPEQGQPRETVITSNPMDWVIRGLH